MTAQPAGGGAGLEGAGGETPAGLESHRICNADYGRVACYCSALQWMTLDAYGRHLEAVAAAHYAAALAGAREDVALSMRDCWPVKPQGGRDVWQTLADAALSAIAAALGLDAGTDGTEAGL